MSSSSDSDLTFLLVDRMFCHFWFMWPIAVAGVIFKYLLTASSVKPGNVARWPFLTAWMRADLVQLNIALYR
jgi:hypothetical protein